MVAQGLWAVLRCQWSHKENKAMGNLNGKCFLGLDGGKRPGKALTETM